MAIATDVLNDLLRVKNAEATKTAWNAAPTAITANRSKLLSLSGAVYLGSQSADSYVIDGVDLLPTQVAELEVQYQIRALFLGCSQMTLDRFDRFPGRSQGYASLPEDLRRQIVQDVPRWSAFIAQEASRFGYPYIDMSDDFAAMAAGRCYAAYQRYAAHGTHRLFSVV